MLSLRRVVFIVVAIFILLLTGCSVTVEQHVSVLDNGQVDIAEKILVPGIFWAAMKEDSEFDTNVVKEEIQKLFPNAEIIELRDIVEKDKGGVKVVLRFSNINDAILYLTSSRDPQSGKPIPSFIKEAQLKESGNLLYKKYVFEMRTDQNAFSDFLKEFDEMNLGLNDLSLVAESLLDFSFSLTLPYPISIATGVDGPPTLSRDRKTVTWKLPLNKPTVIQVESARIWTPIAYAAGAGIPALVALALVVLLRRPTP